MRHRESALLLVAVSLLGAGCYGRALVRGPITTEENAREIALIRTDQLEAEDRLARLEALAEEQAEILRELRAASSVDSEEGRGQLRTLEERAQESMSRIERLEGKIDRLLYRSGQAPPAGAPAPSDTAAPVSIDPKPLYDAAYLDLIRGNYSAARAGFDAFLQAYPASALSDDARYWIGECHLAEGDPGEAAAQFAKVEREFPDSERVPAALLKLATCRLELGEKAEARKILTRIVEEHKAAVEASLAKEKLKQTD